jgi:hypothetical protein
MSLPEPRSPEEKLPADSDLQVQAVPGHGIPSQDPDPAAQLPLLQEDSEREAQSVLVGGGLIAGAAGAVNTAASDQQALQDPGR